MATTTRVLSAAVSGTVYTSNLNDALEAIDTCHSGTTAPTDEVAVGKLWIDTTTTPAILKVYNNSVWEEIGGSASSPTFVDGTFTGDVTIGDDLFVTGPDPVINIVETGVNQHRIVGTSGILYIQAQDSDGTADGDMHLTGYNNNTLNLLNIKAADTTISGDVAVTGNVSGVDGAFTGDVTIGDDLFITGPNPKITMTDNDVADEYGEVYHTSGNNFYAARNGAVNGQHIFYQHAGAVQTEPMRIDENGRLGLGIQNPTEKLDVVGTALISGSIVSGNGGGAVALTTNDGQGNANVTFNHAGGVPDFLGNGGRIVVNTDSAASPKMTFELGSAVTSGVSYNTTEKFRIEDAGITVTGSITSDTGLLAGADASVGAVGTYAMMEAQTVNTLGPGDTVAGADLDYSSTTASAASPSPAGTWRVMGNFGAQFRETICLRIS